MRIAISILLAGIVLGVTGPATRADGLPFYNGPIEITSMVADIDVGPRRSLASVTVEYTLKNPLLTSVPVDLDRTPLSYLQIDGGAIYDPSEYPSLNFAPLAVHTVTQTYTMAVLGSGALKGIRFNPMLLFPGYPSNERIGEYKITVRLPSPASSPTQENKTHTSNTVDLAGSRIIVWEFQDVYHSTLYFEYDQGGLITGIYVSFDQYATFDDVLDVTVLVINDSPRPLQDIVLVADFLPEQFTPEYPQEEFELHGVPGGEVPDDDRWIWTHEIPSLGTGQTTTVHFSLSINGQIPDQLHLAPLRAVRNGRIIGSHDGMVLYNDVCGNGVCNQGESFLTCLDDCSFYSDADEDGVEDFEDPDDDNDGVIDVLDCAPIDPRIHPGADEICDDIDQDCDGEIEFDRPIGTDAGLCESGVMRCTDGQWIVVQPAVGARPEVVDDLDNDCDGLVDENNQDVDGDGVPNVDDNCPHLFNPQQSDIDDDTRGDVCDNCPQEPNPAQLDSDLDTFGNVCDNCPFAYDPQQVDSDQDGVGDVCEPLGPDQDQDTYPDDLDNCPEIYNPEQRDPDEDGLGNACDNCPEEANPEQADCDEDGLGDVCAISSGQDTDNNGDGIPDSCQSLCAEDLDGSGAVDFGDVLKILSAWGPCGGECPEDLDGNGVVDFADLLLVLANWGDCPE